jgi:micrococcal nuclease
MYFKAITSFIEKKPLIITRFVDGDGIILKDLNTKKEIEIRFYGIDAPEISKCKKVNKDEKETMLPASLLRELGRKSLNFLIEQINIGDKCTLVQEKQNLKDKYGRTLGYVVMEDGSVLNEIMIKEGYAKPYNDFYCEMLPKYQEYYLQAKINKKGLFSIIDHF